ncbi:MAG: Periplasmic oligopeptide-binding protein precursor [Verrucomicrobiota bacterium]
MSLLFRPRRVAPIARLAFSSLILAFVVALAAGCAKRETPAAAGLRTRTLLVGNQNEPATLDPHLIDAFTDMNIAVALFEGLTVLDEATAQPLPAAAERWEISADGLVYTFHLRRDGRWSNGDALTARDFAFSLQRILSPKLASPYAYVVWPLKNAEAYHAGKLADFARVGVHVVDDLTLRLTLERPTPYLPALAALAAWMPVHRATIEKFGAPDARDTAWTRPANLVGNGPFTLAEWKPNARIAVAKNPRHRDAARNRLERVEFFPVEKSDTEELSFRAGQLHVTYALPAAKIATYRAQSPERLRVEPLLNTYYVNFNVTKPPLDRADVRRALALAIDREALVRTVYAGAAQPTRVLTAPDHSGYAPPARPTHDFAAARALLAAAGFPGGAGLPPLSIQTLNDDKLPRVAEVLQTMWQRELGVRVGIEPFEQKTWIQNQQSLAHTIALMGWTADYADPITFLDIFRTGGGNNWTGWGDQAYDALLATAANTADPAARFQVLQRAETLLLDVAPIAPFALASRAYLIHPAVKGWGPAPLGFHRYQLVELANP